MHRRLFALLLGSFVLNCGGVSALDVARATWNSSHLSSYRYRASSGGFARSDPTVVTVRNGSVAEVVTEGLDAAGSSTRQETRPAGDPMDALFDRVASATNVTFDPTYGYPVHATFSYGSEYETLDVSEFHVIDQSRRCPDARADAALPGGACGLDDGPCEYPASQCEAAGSTCDCHEGEWRCLPQSSTTPCGDAGSDATAR